MDREQHPDEWISIAMVLGRSLRMIGARDDAAEYLTAAIGHVSLSRSETATAWLNVALIEESRRNTAAAVAAAEKVISLSKAASSSHLQAKVILAGLSLTGAEKTAALAKYEKRARSQGYTSLAEGITLELAGEAATRREKYQHYDKVLSAKPFGYNQTRAIVFKAQLAVKTNAISNLTTTDILYLSSAYSYSHAQRMGSLFDGCHEALWSYFEHKGSSAELFRIFRHSSFLWRLRGEDSKETEYLDKLRAVQAAAPVQPTARGLLIEFKYFLSRVASLFPKGTPAS